MITKIAVSMGDYNGIGPEVTLKALTHIDLTETAPILIGHPDVYQFYTKQSGICPSFHIISSPSEARPGVLSILPCSGLNEPSVEPGRITELSGKWSMKAVTNGIHFCMQNECDALVTAPISKEAIHRAGYHVPGHTEFLAEQTNTDSFMMILASDELRVGLVTGHIPLKEVADSISDTVILDKLRTLHRSLQNDFGIDRPRIALFGLNPHAGDGGVLGTEEVEIITPALGKASAEGILVEGPLPADGFFGNRMQDQFDGILAMYHDQGLVPFKTLSFGKGVNFTAGLPIIRTSPDHGTAFSIAGNNHADERSFRAAFELAVRMAKIRKRHTNDS
jgi:4-hydroxythreonine-4-phosphate dehydrogenase